MLPWAVRELATDAIVGSTRYHDIVAADRPGGDRLDLVRRRRGNAATSTPPASCCSSRHAFETLGCEVVGLRTDNFNFASQRAIEALGREEGRRAPPPHGAARRLGARQRDLQPARRRVAGRSQAPRRPPRAPHADLTARIGGNLAPARVAAHSRRQISSSRPRWRLAAARISSRMAARCARFSASGRKECSAAASARVASTSGV